MKYIPSIIETFHDRGEDYWQISVSAEYTAEAAMEFAALHLCRADTVVFRDVKTTFTIRPDSATLGQRTVSLDKTWLEAVWCPFLDTHRNGWSDTAHIDQDFCDKNGSLCITIRLAPPA